MDATRTLFKTLAMTALMFSLLTVVGCSGRDDEAAAPEPGAAPTPQPAVTPAAPVEPAAAPEPEAETPPVVRIKTDKGDIVIELNPEKAPITVENFLEYVDAGFYDGTIFHRVISTFMVQGGGFTPDYQEKATGPPIRNEAANGLLNLRGTVAMARTSEVDSATAQFFINVVDNDQLDHAGDDPPSFGYCVFGKVVEGMDVVDRIRHVDTARRGTMRDVPREHVVIRSAARVE